MRILSWMALLLFLSSSYLCAGEQARLKSELKLPDEVWVGQRVKLYVTLFGDGQFSGAPKFDLPNLSGVLLMKISDRPLIGTEDIEGTTYTTQRHEFGVYAQRPGTVTLPAFKVRFSVGAFGAGEPAEFELETSEHGFEAKRPPGAEGLASIISSRGLIVEEAWRPEPGDAKTGDAFTRIVTFRAPDVSGMAFWPLPSMVINGLGIYPKAPQVQDKSERGDFTGERKETVTYVCERPGDRTIPALVFHWFDLESKQLRRVELPSIEISVTQGPSAVAGTGEGAGSFGYAWLLVPALLLLGAGILWRYRTALRSHLAAWRARREEREVVYFTRLVKACRGGNPTAALNALMNWLDRINEESVSPTISSFLHGNPDPKLEQELDTMQGTVLQGKGVWSGSALETCLKRHRRASRKGKGTAKSDLLPALNPRKAMV